MTFSFVDIGGKRYSRDRDANECPICHYGIQPKEVAWNLASTSVGPKQILERVFVCPRRECSHIFIARYKRCDTDIPTNLTGIIPGAGIREFVFYESTPQTPTQPNIPKEVTSISPLFPEIYSQSQAAESFDLDQIAGVGYRKALEFLIKDYCIATNPESKEQIRSIQLGNCIERFVNNPQIKICAQRATWIGNDETHYVRRWLDKDITNLKELILLTVNWIHSNILTRKYEDDMTRS